MFLSFTLYGRSVSGDEGYIVIDDQEGQSIYPLSEDREIHLHGPVGDSVIAIENGKARFISSDCDDKLCVQMGPVYRAGEWSACLPNKIFLYTGGKQADEKVDAGVY